MHRFRRNPFLICYIIYFQAFEKTNWQGFVLTGVISYVVGNGVSLVSSAEETAKDLYRVLVENNLLHSSTKNADHRFLATGDAKAFETLARRFLGPEVGRVEHQIL